MAMSGGWSEYLAVVGERERLIRIEPEGDDLRMRIDGEEFVVSGFEGMGRGEICLLMNARPQVVHVRSDSPGRYRVSLAGGEIGVDLKDPLAARVARGGGSTIRHAREVILRAPMPGVVVAVQAREGEAVAREAPLVVLEAMKMQNALTSPIDGIVRRVHVKPGQTVDGEAILVILERPHERPHERPEISESPPNDTPESEIGRGA